MPRNCFDASFFVWVRWCGGDQHVQASEGGQTPKRPQQIIPAAGSYERWKHHAKMEPEGSGKEIAKRTRIHAPICIARQWESCIRYRDKKTPPAKE